MKVTILDDFSLSKIAHSGQCFRVREFSDGTYRFIIGKNILYIKNIDTDTYEVSCTDEEWKEIWVPYFDLKRNYLEIRKSIPTIDTYLSKAAIEGQGIRILCQDPWEIMVTFIISQRKSIPAIKQSVELLATRFGSLITTPYEKIYTFPMPHQLAQASEEELYECKLGYRVPYVADAVDRVLSGTTNLSLFPGLSDTELIKALKEVHGVGDKVANCICLFAYGRTNMAPIDTWILKIINKEYNGMNPFPFYGETAGIMQQYAFYYAQSHKGELTHGSNNNTGRNDT